MGELSEVFYSLLVTTCVGLILGLARMAYKSKCKEVTCCCMTVVRDTVAEEKEFELTAIHTKNNNDNI
jgi:hypothetical protein